MIALGNHCHWQPSEVMRLNVKRRRLLTDVILQANKRSLSKVAEARESKVVPKRSFVYGKGRT